MEFENLFSIICGGGIIMVIIGIIVIGAAVLIIRGIVHRTRRKVGIPKGTGNVIRKQLANFDQYVQNDERQVNQWQSTSPTREPELDLNDIEVDDLPVRPTPQKEQPEALPDWDADSLVCSACGAPRQPGDKVCGFCSHKHS